MTTNDSVTPNIDAIIEDREAKRKAVAAEVEEKWRAAKAFTPERYTQQVLNPGIEAEVRRQHKGKLSSEIDADQPSECALIA